MYESVVLLNIMVFLMLYSVKMYENNYYIHSFWILAITWYGVLCMIAEQDIIYCLLIIVFTDILCIFHMEYAIRKKNEVDN